ncbi:hypothetical protein [Novosphingobium taihuense]|uniref:Spore coat protein U-like protein n=2 Tax=Novosphingobium taihuense TaxID=260085 RepID=A0A7W7AAG5_9SPHN|nr:hypothetical protein [Novosphingobium taihuense]MBB4613418.1 hypothetical protein [Novosphingobium taihuense]
MKRASFNLLPLALVLAMLTVGTHPASAQAVPQEGQTALVIQIRADAPRDCRVTSAQVSTLDPLSRGWQRLSLPDIACNYSGRPAVRFWSQNSGTLVPEGAVALALPAGLAYELRVGGTVVGRPGSAGDPLVSVLPQSSPLQPRSTEVAIRFLGPTPPPGTFADTIFMEVTP